MRAPIVIDGGILAGGLATRMQGQDKGLQLYQHKMMVEWVYEALAPKVRKVFINCNRNADVYQNISPHLCQDARPDFPGPLAGILSLMTASDADYLLISPCDTPKISDTYAMKMLAHLDQLLQQEGQKPQLFAVLAEGREQPLHMCISRQYQRSLEAYLDRGEQRVMRWMFENHAQWLDFSAQAAQFQNYNTLDSLSIN